MFSHKPSIVFVMNRTFSFNGEMDREKPLQSAGICHRLFFFIMKSLTSQAAKPVILGPLVIHQQTQSLNGCCFDSEGMISIGIEDETRALLDNKRDGCRQEERKGTGEIGTKTKNPRKMVSIKDEPEIICSPNKRRRKNERQMLGIEGDVRPLKSILKVGSKLRENSPQKTSPNSTNNTIMYY
ncbi:hypothetical protein RND81_04G010500 [Saponaria officinalis]|uniref:Uncharacterized protein n=1 Tax=Saponaria officinalis TaxID=3572 RepID=A0AAW1LHA5_SAPOF